MKFAIFSIILGLIAGLMMPGHAFKDIASGMLTLVGITVAAVVPAMALTVSTMRASGRSVKAIKQFRIGLNEQLTFWLSFLAVAAMIAASVLFASIIDWPTKIYFQFDNEYFPIKLTFMTIINAAISSCLILIIAKSTQFARGVRDLLNLQMDQVEAESREMFKERKKPVQQELETKSYDPKFGEILE